MRSPSHRKLVEKVLVEETVIASVLQKESAIRRVATVAPVYSMAKARSATATPGITDRLASCLVRNLDSISSPGERCFRLLHNFASRFIP